jgi:hypothetical protein
MRAALAGGVRICLDGGKIARWHGICIIAGIAARTMLYSP